MLLMSESDLFQSHIIIEKFDASHIQRLFVVGDLHGCFDELMAQLNILNFNFSDDLLISVGDLVDRGKDSLKCLELTKEPWFKAIRGNHEQMCLEASLAEEMIGVHLKHGGEWLYKLSAADQLICLDICLHLPIILEVRFKGRKYGFVHADIPLNNWGEFKKAICINDYFNSEKASNLRNALWGSNSISTSLNINRNKEVNGIDEVYLGHTFVQQPTRIQNCIYIDTGIVLGNKLTIIEL